MYLMSVPETIPSFDLKRNYARVEGEIKEALNRVLSSTHFILGPEVAEFEREVSGYLEAHRAVSAASGTDALLLALMALGIKPGDEVITTPFSFFATVSCITRMGAKAVFADVEPDSYNISMERVREAVTPRTKAFIPVHLFGQMCGLEDIDDVLRERGIALVEDCAQAFGAHRMRGGEIVRAGVWGELGAFSFFPTKNLGAFGDAGMVTCSTDALGDRVAKLRVHGSTSSYLHEEIGINSRLDAMQAAILRVRLRHIEAWTEERREAARRYGLLFAERGLEGRVTLPAVTDGNRHTYHQYVIRASRRDELQKFLADKGVTTRVYYPLSLHMQPCFAYLGYKKGDFPVSERLTEEVLALPMFPELTMDEQERTVDAIAGFYGG
ncbi:MAG: DegT/DnrJ/EryC1/StrS family aminotransferase [Synergistaceae bacterium]|jgi:dTDP-4-amino-4,6-dideoxygalactose transaminase|nr:DegT/DnrJ/EryC1/StrS family aminotransferase [Synergistaceae bacterium]